jgi:hypothetical protein
MNDEVMKEPAYILENGTPVPYVPLEVKTARDAYAASLHVLFKHVADFHLCIVRTFSTKYGIPEDEILQTIQDSEEFKNMKVDPVLDPDKFNTLGYLQSTPVQEEPVKEAPPPPPPVKKPKAKKVVPSVVVEPIVVLDEEERHDPAPATNVVALHEPETIKPKTIRKKVVQKPAVEPSTAVNLFDITTTNVIAANTNGTLQAQVLETKTPVPSTEEQIKPKTIRKKVVQKQIEVVAPATEATNAVAPATNAVAPATNAVAPDTNAVDAPRKIIRKNVPV